jgi:hypothetical protein
MADSIVGGLFGITPEMYQQQVAQQSLAQGEQLGEMSPDAFGRSMLYAGASQLGRGIGSALGGVDPQLQLISIRNAVMQDVDPNNPVSLQTAIQKLSKAGDQVGALQLTDYLRKAQSDYALIQQRTAEKLTPEVRNAVAYASSIAPQGTEEFNKAYQAKLDEQTSKAEKAPPSMVAEYQFAKTPDGGGFKGTYQEFVTARALASRPPGQPRPEQPPVPVVDPKTGKVILVSREEAIANRLTPASSMESLTPKEIQTREAKYPQATTAVKTFQTSAEKLASDLETLADSKGLEGITGLIGGRTPAITKDARAAEALYKSIVARGGFNELQNLRNASPTGGALGNVSNQEGQQLKNAFAPLELTQNASDLKAALKRAAVETRASANRIKETYDLTYEYKNQGAQPSAPTRTPSTSTSPMSADDLVNKYLNK